MRKKDNADSDPYGSTEYIQYHSINRGFAFR